jgi:hypothetical protein
MPYMESRLVRRGCPIAYRDMHARIPADHQDGDLSPRIGVRPGCCLHTGEVAERRAKEVVCRSTNCVASQSSGTTVASCLSSCGILEIEPDFCVTCTCILVRSRRACQATTLHTNFQTTCYHSLNSSWDFCEPRTAWRIHLGVENVNVIPLPPRTDHPNS